MSRDVIFLDKKTTVANFISAQVKQVSPESVYRVVVSKNWVFDDQPDSILLDSFGINETQDFGKVEEKIDWRSVEKKQNEASCEKGKRAKVEKRCCQVLESSDFKHSPRWYEPSPHTLETIGPRDFEVEDSKNEPSQFKVVSQVAGRRFQTYKLRFQTNKVRFPTNKLRFPINKLRFRPVNYDFRPVN
jgi:hypothetical protein